MYDTFEREDNVLDPPRIFRTFSRGPANGYGYLYQEGEGAGFDNVIRAYEEDR